MKTLLFIIIIVFNSSVSAQLLKEAQQKKMYVHARDGLSLRTEPNKNSMRIKTLEYGTQIYITHQTDSLETINGLSGRWVKVNLNDTIGYAFDAYLSSYIAPKNDDHYPYLKDYVYQVFEQTGGDKDFEIVEMNQLLKSAKFGEIEYALIGDECELNETITIPDADMQEMMVVFSSWIFTYNVTKDIKDFSFDDYENQYVHHITKETEPFYLNYYLSADWNEEQKFTFYQVHFDWEGGGGSLSFQYKPDIKGVKIIHTYGCH